MLGVNPHGLYIFRFGQINNPIVKFSWSECRELAFTEKKFTIQVSSQS